MTVECRSSPELVELLGSAACDALDADERIRLDRHLAGCAECRDELIGLRRVVERLSVLKATDVGGC